jgi:hypothetical protein
LPQRRLALFSPPHCCHLPPHHHLQIYSCNEGNYAAFPRGFQRFLDDAKGGEKPYSLRYVGSMVADVHRTLLYGGIFAYGPTLAAPGGKLRLLYEVNPMSMIMEQAGGKVRQRDRERLERGWGSLSESGAADSEIFAAVLVLRLIRVKPHRPPPQLLPPACPLTHAA